MGIVVEPITICSDLVFLKSLLDSTSLVGFIAMQIKEVSASNIHLLEFIVLRVILLN